MNYKFLLVTIALLVPIKVKADSHKFEGVASCASSNCHGNSKPVSNSAVSRNEFTTWLRHDRHSKAYQTLLNERSKIIAKNLGISNPESDKKCLTCHATFLNSSQLKGEKFRTEDGVGCESCHGASELWITSHIEDGAKYSANIANGMTDLKNISVKSKLCISCHLGDEDRKITHEIYGAGHPRLSFELDTYESVMPRHWALSKDHDPVREWLIGLAVQTKIRILTAGREGNFIHNMPDFTAYPCTTCHHSLNKEEYKRRDYGNRPGTLKLNFAELKILSEVTKVFDKDLSTKLQEMYKNLIVLKTVDSVEPFVEKYLEEINEGILKDLESISIPKEKYEEIFHSLNSLYNASADYEIAEQVALGSSVISSALKNPKQMKDKVNKLYSELSLNELP